MRMIPFLMLLSPAAFADQQGAPDPKSIEVQPASADACKDASVRVLLEAKAQDPRLAATEQAFAELLGAGMLSEVKAAQRIYCPQAGSWAIEQGPREQSLAILRGTWGEALRVEERAALADPRARVNAARVSKGLKPVKVSLQGGDYGTLFDGGTQGKDDSLLAVMTQGGEETKMKDSRRLDDSEVDFNAVSKGIEQVCSQAQIALTRRLDSIAQEKSPSFKNTIASFDEALGEFFETLKPRLVLSAVSTEKPVRDASRKCEAETSKFMLGLYMREDLYKTLNSGLSAAGSLNEEDSRLAKKTLKAFKDNGLDLPADKRAHFKKIQERLVDLSTAFEETVAEVKDFMLMTREQLEGLPQGYIDRVQSYLLTPEQVQGLPKDFIEKQLKKSGGDYVLTQEALASLPKEAPADFSKRLEKAKKTYCVTTQYPDVLPFFDNAKDARARKAVLVMFNNRGGQENKERLSEMVRLRDEAAKMLGYKNHAEIILEDRMAKTPEAVMEFIGRVRGKLEGKAADERRELLDLKNSMEGKASDGVLNPWDVNYYSNQRMKQKYSVDQESLRRYFPTDRVVSGAMEVYQKVLGVRFEEMPGAKTWHPDAKGYRVVDSKSGEVLGEFLLDLYPRQGKFTHAMVTEIVPSYERKDGSYRLPISAMVSNMEKPTKDKPSLLSHDEVETFFHEFGHLMHNTLGRSRYQTLSGYGTSMDFVEAPSQMFENWAWNEQVLDRISGDYQDPSKKLPAELARKLIAAKNAGSGMQYLRQCFLATYDMTLHMQGAQDTTKLYGDLTKEITHMPMTEGTIPEASFAHIASGGYDSGYYSYLWSLVYAQDLFTRLEKDPFDPRAGRELREKVLGRGGSRDEMKDIEEYLGRKPNEEAFLRSIGAVEKKPAEPKGLSGVMEKARKWAASLGKN
jgi:thimet oligopeptidase